VALFGCCAVPPAVAELELALLGAQLRPLGEFLDQTRLLATRVGQARPQTLRPPANDVRVGQHMITHSPETSTNKIDIYDKTKMFLLFYLYFKRVENEIKLIAER